MLLTKVIHRTAQASEFEVRKGSTGHRMPLKTVLSIPNVGGMRVETAKGKRFFLGKKS